MRLYLIIGQRVCRYPGEFAPEVLDCWDENTFYENPRGYEDRFKSFSETKDFTSVRELIVNVDQAAVDALFEVPEVDATIPS
jgi:hypothetical protein